MSKAVRGNPEVLAGLLKRIGNFDPSRFAWDFDQRLILQKTVYLLQRAAGIELDYHYNWYLRGPYSPTLARDAYRMIDLFEPATQRRFVKDESEGRFERFIEWLQPNAQDARWLELAASSLYLKRQEWSVERIFEEMRRKIPSLSEREFNATLSRLAQVES